MGEHRRKKIFAQEFGTYFAQYIINLKINRSIILKINGPSPRAFSFVEYFVKSGGTFTKLIIKNKVAYNGCKMKKQRRL